MDKKDRYRMGGMEVLIDALGGNKHPIEAQEAREQARLIAAQRLPKKINHPATWDLGKQGLTLEDVYKAFGIEILPTGDDLFNDVKLPKGWAVKPSDHSMWNHLYDDKDRKRMSIFYKGAFYDRDAFFNLETRFQVNFSHGSKDYIHQDARIGMPHWGEVVKDGEVVFQTESKAVQSGDIYRALDEMESSMRAECAEWLEENYPDHAHYVKQWEYP